MVYQPVLSAMDNIGWYITQFLSVVDKISRNSNWFFLSWTKIVVFLPILSVIDNIGWYITEFCLSWTILFSTAHCFVCH